MKRKNNILVISQSSEFSSLVSTFNCRENQFSRLLKKRISSKQFFLLCSLNEFSRNVFFFALLAKRVLRKRDTSSAFETNYQPKYNDTNVLDPAKFCDTFGLVVAHKSKILFITENIKKYCR